MPIFEYLCENCDHETQLSVFAVSAKGTSSMAGSSGGACGSCGDPRGPGSCSMPDLD